MLLLSEPDRLRCVGAAATAFVHEHLGMGMAPSDAGRLLSGGEPHKRTHKKKTHKEAHGGGEEGHSNHRHHHHHHSHDSDQNDHDHSDHGRGHRRSHRRSHRHSHRRGGGGGGGDGDGGRGGRHVRGGGLH